MTVEPRNGLWYVTLPEGLTYRFSLRATAVTFAQMAQSAEGAEYQGEWVKVPF